MTNRSQIPAPLRRPLLALVLALLPAAAYAQSGTWTNLSSGSWANAANWSGGTVASGSGNTANFSTLTLLSSPAVTLDGAKTIGGLTFGDVGNTYGWSLNTGSGGPLTLAVSSGVPTITVNGQTNTINLVLAGSGGLLKTGPGALALSAQATYTGGTVITNGILDLTGGGGGSGTIRGATTVYPNGTLRISTGDAFGYNGGSSSISPVNISGGLLYINSTANQTLGSATLNLTGGTINGTTGGNLDFYGGGSALNSLASPTTSVITNIPLSPLRQGPTTFSVAAGTTSSGIDLDIWSVLRVSPSGDAANAVLTKTGAGTMRLNAVNTIARPVVVSAGKLMLAGSGSLASVPTLTVSGSGSLDVSTLSSTYTLGTGKTLVAGNVGTAVTNINGNVNSTGTNNIAGSGIIGTETINGNVALTNATLVYDLFSPTLADVLVPKGTLTLSGTVTVQPLDLGNGTFTLVNGASSISGTAANLALGTVGARGTPSSSFTVGTTNITLTVSGLTPASLVWQGSANGAWDVNTTSNWLNSGTSSSFYNMDAVAFADSPTTAVISNTTAVFPSSVTFSNSATAYTITNTGNAGIAGGTALIKTNGSGTVYLTAANNYSGGTFLGSGTLSLGNGNSGSENDLALGNGTVTITGGTLLMQPGGSSATWTVANPIVLNGGTIQGKDGFHHLSGTVSVGSSGGTINQYWDTKSVWLDGVVSGSGPLTINSGSGGAYTGIHFSNPLNTYSGTISVTGNCLMLDNNNALTNATISLSVNNGLQFNAAVTAPAIGGLTGSSTENLPSTVNLSVGNNGVSSTFAGTLTNSGSLTKTGSGTFTLTGAGNTYTGPTKVSGGTLAGNGAIASAVTVQAGGTLAPGTASIGTFTIKSNLTLNGTVLFRISKTGGVLANDQVAGLTGLTSGGTLVVTNITTDSTALAAGDTFTLFNLASGSFSGTFSSYVLPALSSTNLAWNTNLVASSGILSVVGVGAAQAPIFSPVPGGYIGPVSLTISDSGNTIYYTTDGSNPTNSPTVLSATNSVVLSIPVNTVETVLAYAAQTGYANSPVVGGTYATASQGVWSNTAGGAWGTSGNWTNGIIGSGANITADFSALTLTSNLTISLNGLQTIGNARFGDQGNTYQTTLATGSGGPLYLVGTNTPTFTINNQNLTNSATLSGTNGLIIAGSGKSVWTVNPSITAGGLTFNNAGATNVILTGNFAATFTPLVTINTNVTVLGNNYHALGGGTAVVVNHGTYLLNDEDYKQSITMRDGLIALSGVGNGNGLRVGFAGGTGTYNWYVTNSVAGSVISSPINTIGGGLYLVFNVARGAAPYDLTLGGIISNGGGLVFNGPGITALTNANTYTNTTVLTNGSTLEVDGSIQSTAAVTVYTNSTLAGTGSLSGPVSLLAGSRLAPGTLTNLGTLYITSTVNLAGAGYFRISKTGGTIVNDQLSGFSSLTVSGPLVVTNVTSDATPLAVGDTFQLFSAPVTGGFTSITLPTLPAGLSWDTSSLLASGSINVVANAGPPTFSPPAGSYVGATVVTISSTTPGATIYYTIDGSTPTTSSPSGINPVTVTVPVNTNLTIQAFAAATGQTSSSVQSAAYTTITTPTWNVNSGGSWDNSSYWLANIIANGVGVTADFSQQTLVGNNAVTLDSTPVVGTLLFGDQGNASTWEIDPGIGGPLTLNNGTNKAVITVLNQTLTITAPLAGTNGLVVNGPGTLTLATNASYTGNTVVNSGTLNLSYNGNSSGNSPSGTLQGTLTVNSNATVVTTVGNALGYGGSQWVQTINLNYGTLETSIANIDEGWGTTINMVGGTLGSTVSNGRFAMGGSPVFNVTGTNVPSVISANMTVRDSAPGGILFNVSRGAAATDLDITGNLLGVGSGGISLSGNGIMTLAGANTYSGATTVSNGTLVVNGSLAAASAVSVMTNASLAGNGIINGPVAVYAGATLSTDPAGIGALTISNSLYLNGAVKLRLNAGTSTNDVLRGITSLTYGGTLTVSNLSGTLSAGQTFTLFSAGSTSGNFAATNLPALPTGLTWNWTPAAGTLAVVSAVNTTPTNLMASVSGSSLTLTWPADHVGWRLQEQTNNVANGVSANPADWGTVSGSTTTNSETITINPTVPGGYYRLVYP